MGGLHANFEYLYSHGTANTPSIATGEITYINAQNFMIQRHQTMGYAYWDQPQFALLNLGNTSEIWVKATPGVDDGTFSILRSHNGTFDNGSVYDTDLSTHGGTVTTYDKLKDNANTFYSDLIVPLHHVSIGTGNIDPNYSLAVKGNVHAQKVVVELTNWPDYVFKPTYNLKPLSEVKSYIDQNHHLPEMPSEKEVAEKGVDLGEMNKLLTKKVEELTLYMIEKDKENKQQQEQINQLKEQMVKVLEKIK